MEQSEEAPVVSTWHSRLRHRIGVLFGVRRAYETPREAEIRIERDRLQNALEDREARIRTLKVEIDGLKSQLKVADVENKLLAAVCARNQTRVDAESATHANHIASVTSEMQ